MQQINNLHLSEEYEGKELNYKMKAYSLCWVELCFQKLKITINADNIFQNLNGICYYWIKKEYTKEKT